MSGPDDLFVDMEHAPAAHRRSTGGNLIEELRDAPHWDDATELAAVVDVLHGLSVEPLSSERDAAGVMAAQMAAALRHAQEQPRVASPARRHRARVAAVLVAASMAASTGLAAADMLPDPFQRLASGALDWFGISVPRPGSDGQSGVEPGTGTSRRVDIDGPTRTGTDPDATAPTGSLDGSNTPDGTTHTSTSAGDGSDEPGGTDSVTDSGSTRSPDSGSVVPDDPVGSDPTPTYPPTDDTGGSPDSSWPDTTSPDSTTPSYDDDPAPPADAQPFPTTDPGTSTEPDAQPTDPGITTDPATQPTGPGTTTDPATQPTGPGTTTEPTPQPTDPGTGDGAVTGYGPTTETTTSSEPSTGPRS